MTLDLAAASSVMRLLSDPTRIRLLAVLDSEELTVAEIADVLRLAQPRVSTHLAKLKEAGWVLDRRAGVSAYYRAQPHTDMAPLLRLLSERIEDGLLHEDRSRLPEVLARRARANGWADRVAGDMERHYSPGRTWETLTRAVALLTDLGDVLDVASGDGVTASLLAPRARSIACVDASARVVAAARTRLAAHANVDVREGDMHALDFAAASFDLVLLLHALAYSDRPSTVLAEAARVLRPRGRLLAVTLAEHTHRGAVEPFGHRNHGESPDSLAARARDAGLTVLAALPLNRESRAPHFQTLALLAEKP